VRVCTSFAKAEFRFGWGWSRSRFQIAVLQRVWSICYLKLSHTHTLPIPNISIGFANFNFLQNYSRYIFSTAVAFLLSVGYEYTAQCLTLYLHPALLQQPRLLDLMSAQIRVTAKGIQTTLWHIRRRLQRKTDHRVRRKGSRMGASRRGKELGLWDYLLLDPCCTTTCSCISNTFPTAINIFTLILKLANLLSFSPEDQAFLEAQYKENPKPNKAARAEIVKSVKLNEKEVQVCPLSLRSPHNTRLWALTICSRYGFKTAAKSIEGSQDLYSHMNTPRLDWEE